MSSNSYEWETPQELFDELNNEFNLDVDVCATNENAKRKVFFTKESDGLKQDWLGLRCWMNPPYGRQIGDWVQKAAEGGASVVVALLPARTDTRWFHDYIYNKAEIRFLKGRVKFSGKGPAPFPSMIVIWKKH
jgi:phage N-6-adenine-methyltransferase